jgi:hypothetical protein
MTQRVTVSLPDDVATRLEQETNASDYVTAAVRRRMAVESIEHLLRGQGFAITAEGRAAARTKLDAARARTTPDARARLRARFGRER